MLLIERGRGPLDPDWEGENHLPEASVWTVEEQVKLSCIKMRGSG